jgi:branched-chain amino acid transport system ATP-binding protein
MTTNAPAPDRAGTGTAAPALELRGVSSGYQGATVLRNIDLVVATGSITALLGPNGAGKTTLLKTASGLIKATSGSVHIDGEDVTGAPANRRAALGLCHIPEGRGVFRSMTVRENLKLQTRKGQPNFAERALEAFPILAQRLDQKAGRLSGGQQQMLALARAYTGNPSLVLVDEASLGLAPIIVDAIFEFLGTISREGSSLLVVDQYIARALSLASRVYVLGRGEIVFDGSPNALRDSDVFARYLGESTS